MKQKKLKNSQLKVLKNEQSIEKNEMSLQPNSEQFQKLAQQSQKYPDQKSNGLDAKEIQSQKECSFNESLNMKKLQIQSDEKIQQYYDCCQIQQNINESKSQAPPCPFQKDLLELKSYINIELLNEYVDKGAKTVEEVENKDVLILIGTTGVGKTTTLLYLLGYQMQEEDFKIEYLDEQGNKQVTTKKVIESKEKLEKARIGNTNVSETQFLNVFNIQHKKKKFLLSDSPGFRDKRKLEIDLSNNLNTMNMLKACKSIRFIFLVNYFELKAERGAPFTDTALIAAKMLNGSDFEKNLESVCVFYTQAQGVNLINIRTEIISVKKDIKSQHTISTQDKDLLTKFLNYLIDQIDEDDSMILNPLDNGNRQTVLEKIFNKNEMKEPYQKISSFSFSVESESRIKLYCNLVKQKIEYYSSQFQFYEISTLLSLLSDLSLNISNEYIDQLIESQQTKIERDFKQKLENQIQEVIENIKNGNRFHEYQINNLNQSNQQLKEWDEYKYPHFTFSKIGQKFLVQQISEQFNKHFMDVNLEGLVFENLIQIFLSLRYLHEVLGEEYLQMKSLISEKIIYLMYEQKEKNISDIKEKLENHQQKNDIECSQLVLKIFNSIEELNNQEEQAKKYELIDTLVVKNQLIQYILDVLNQKKNALMSYFDETLKAIEQESTQKIIQELSSKLDQINPNFYLITAFALSINFSENCPKIQEIEKSVKQKCKDILIKYLGTYSKELKSKELKSQYLQEYFMSFLNKFRVSFYINDSQSEECYRNYRISFEQTVKKKEEKVKKIVKEITQNKTKMRAQDVDEIQNENSIIKELERADRDIKILYSIKCMDSLFENQIISNTIDYCIKKLQKFYNNLINQVQLIVAYTNQDLEINKKRSIYQSLSEYYFQINLIKIHLGQFLQESKQKFQEMYDQLVQQFTIASQKIDQLIESLKKLNILSMNFLFDLETSLMVLKYFPKDLQSNQVVQESDLIQYFDDYLKNQVNQIPSPDEWEKKLLEQDFNQIIKNWARFFEEIDILKLNKSSLITLLKKAIFSQKIIDNNTVKTKIKNLHNNLKNNLNDCVELKNFQKADQISMILQAMSIYLSEYIQLESQINMGSIFRNEGNELLNDIQSENNLKSVKERLLNLKGLPQSNKNFQMKDIEYIEQALLDKYQKNLKILMIEVKAFKITESEQLLQKIENLFEMKQILVEIFDKEKLDNKFNKSFLQPFKDFSNDYIKYQMLQYFEKQQDQDLINLFKWYKKIKECFDKQNVNTSNNMANLDEILIKSLKDYVNQIKQYSIFNWTKIHYQDIEFILNQLKNYIKNLSFLDQNFNEELTQIQKSLIEYLDSQLQNCKNKLEDHFQKNTININEAKKILQKIVQLEQIYTNYFSNSKISKLVQDLTAQLEKYEQELLQFIYDILEQQNQDNQDELQKQIFDKFEHMKQKDKNGFQKSQELLAKKTDEINICIDNMIKQQNNVKYGNMVPKLKQLMMLIKLKSFISQKDRHVVDQAEYLIQKLFDQMNTFQIRFEELLNSNNKEIKTQQIINYFDLQICFQTIKQFHKLSVQTVNLFQCSTIHINNIIYENVRESINNYNLSYNNSNYRGQIRSLLSLKKVDGVIQYIKQLQKIQGQTPDFCDKKLWEIIQSSNISNHQEAFNLTNRQIEQVDNDLYLNWENNNFEVFSQLMKNLKELSEEESLNSITPQVYNQQKEKYKAKMDNGSQKVNSLIQTEEWGEDLCKSVDVQQDQVKGLNGTDLLQTAQSIKDTTQKQLKEKLDEKFSIFQIEQSMENQCRILIELRRISDLVPSFQEPVKIKIDQGINTIVASSNDISIKILDLYNCLSDLNNPLAELILKENVHFTTINVKIFQEKITGQHNPDYINKNLKILDISQKKTNSLPDEEQKNLSQRYNTLQKKFQENVDRYLKKRSQVDKFTEEIIQFASKKSNIDLNNWNQKSQDDCNDLLSKVCAYWTLSSLQKDQIQNENDKSYKQLHASQIYSIMMLLGFENWKNNQMLKNQLIQVLTGEGKSIVLGILSAVLALFGYQVDVVCYSKHLSDRDFQDFEKFFDSLKIKQRIKYGTFTDICDDKINQFGDIRKLSSELLKGNLEKIALQAQDRCVLLIDEVDVFFSDSFYGQTYNPCCLWKPNEIINIQNKIWQNRNLTKQTLTEQIFQDPNFLNLQKQFPELEKLLKVHIRSMIQAAQTINDHKYHFENGRIGYQQHDSISYTTFYGYSTNFAYYKEMDKGKLTQEQVEAVSGINLNCGHFSYRELPKLYSKILGVTGTLETLNQEYLNILKEYDLKATLIPSMFGQTKLNDDLSNFHITFDQDNYFLSIVNQANKYLDQKQPVLIFFKDNTVLEKFKQSSYASQFISQLQILNQQTIHIKSMIDKACRSGQLTLCDRAFGRGTDFYCNNKQVDKLGGVVVIQTFFSEDISEERQIKGRTARQSNEGIFIMIVQACDIQESLHIQIDELKNKSSEKTKLYEELDKKRTQLYAQKISQLTKSANQAQKLHDDTKTYRDIMIKNQKVDALNMLIKFNSGNLNSNQQQIHFLLLLDDSGSMRETDGTNKSRWDRLIEAIHAFILERQGQSYQNDDIASIIYHSSNSISVAKYESLTNLSSILSKNPPRYSGNQFYLAIDEAINVLKNEPQQYKPAKKVIMFLSDGGDCNSSQQRTQSLQQLKQLFKDQILGFWCIGFGPGAEVGALNEMTNTMKECGGQYKQAMNLVELQKNFQDLAVIETVMTMK
ncbi:hypothetical protein ABPG74_022614 [Tetrahymena malaccensis]